MTKERMIEMVSEAIGEGVGYLDSLHHYAHDHDIDFEWEEEAYRKWREEYAEILVNKYLEESHE